MPKLFIYPQVLKITRWPTRTWDQARRPPSGGKIRGEGDSWRSREPSGVSTSSEADLGELFGSFSDADSVVSGVFY